MENVSTNTLMEPDQSQLRQMVLENTERIDKQETMIDKILMESADFSQKMCEKHDRLEHSNEEHDYSIKAIRKCLSEIAQLQKNSIVEHEKSMYELKKHIKENSDKMNERDEKYAKETKERDEKFAKEMRERDEKFAKEMRERDEKYAKETKERDEKFAKEMKEIDEKFAKEMKETDEKFARRMEERDKKFDKEMKERTEKFDRDMKERDEKFAKEMKETDEKFARRMEERDKKFDKEMKERTEKFDRDMKERDEKFAKELKESRDETNAAIRRISIEFLGTNGHIIEGLASSAVDKIFKEAGLDLLRYGKNIKPKQPENHNKMEVDVLLGNETFIVPVEVKADFTKRKVKRFVRQMAMFRTFFPEYADKEIIAAVAAINYADGVDQFAHKEGLLIIRVNSEDIFSLDPFDMKTLRRF